MHAPANGHSATPASAQTRSPTRPRCAGGSNQGETTIAASRHPGDTCPVAAVIAELTHVLTLQNEPVADGAEVDHHRNFVLDDREEALLSIAETSRATSLTGAALQIVLTGHRAADMGAALIGGEIHSVEKRDAAELDRATEAMTRSAYAALAANGGALPRVITERFMPLECDVWATLSRSGTVFQPA